MCSMHLRKGLATFNLHQCGKELGNYGMGGNFLDRRVPLMEELVSEKKARWREIAELGYFARHPQNYDKVRSAWYD